jgi:hypothetical protein
MFFHGNTFFLNLVISYIGHKDLPIQPFSGIP